MGVWRLAPRQRFKDHALQNVGKRPLEHRVEVAISIDLCTQQDSASINLEMKNEQATLTFLLLLYACSPTQETKSNASELKKIHCT